MGQFTEEIMMYPAARRVEQVDEYFGIRVEDPYRWMEDVDSPELAAWVEAENTLTQSWLAQVDSRDAMHKRLMDLTDFERYTVPARHGTRYVYQHNSGLQNQAVVYWQEGLEGERKVLLDPNTLSADGTVALGGLSVTDDGRLAAYALSEAGSDWLTWRVREVETGNDRPDTIQWSKFSGASWMKDGSGFFYAAYDAPGPDATEAESFKVANYFHKVYFHRLGSEQCEDLLVFERPDNAELNLGAGVTEDGCYVVIHQSQGTSPNNELAVLDVGNGIAGAPVIRLITEADAAYSPIDNDGSFFWVQTTLDAPNGKVIGIHLAKPEREHWVTLIPESRNALEQVSLVHDTLIATYMEDAHSVVELYATDGTPKGRLPLPGIGTVGGFGGKRADSETFFAFTNFTTPGVIYRLALDTLTTTIWRAPELRFAPADYETTQVFVPSKDGTRVPVFLSHKQGLPLDGTAPTLLYGYGGFNIPLLPSFSSARVLWMEMGGIYAQACLRGGGEYGEAWHQAGTRLNKQNVFDDFIACAEWLSTSRKGQQHTSPAKLAIQGGSNGGLLVGASITQRPELFGAALAEVGVLDMLRFDKFTIGWAWKAEYGSPSEDEAEFQAIYHYSPLHRLQSEVKYPATMVLTADHDDRVFPAHSFKFTAALQALNPANPALIRVETRAGHGAGMPLSKRVEGVVDQYAFLVRTLNMNRRPANEV